ncbi:MAG TPA: precorrin-3B C(17)-methyltransferase [Streptosporangiaceae bacterium]|jgi:cobalt-precorrin 5A hydrolase/precorrin-3B C17-methyltransferase|nr:precorrin-3B C(17)-methyltransferase [Streptosporangiaceae bacterium]
MIGLIAVTLAGRAAAARLAEAWPGETRSYDGPARQALHRAWAECDGLVCFLAVGATTRLVAPLLDSKWVDPAVVCVDEPGRYTVTLVGGHAAGANELCVRVADVLGAQPIITTATDATGLPGLDTLDWPAEGAIARVSRALLDGEPVGFEADATWPLPALPVTLGGAGPCRIVVTDRIMPVDDNTVLLRPPSLAAGIGASKGVTQDEVLGLLDEALAVGGLSRDSVAVLATVDAKATEQGIVMAARRGGWPLRSFPAGQLATVAVPNPGEAALAAVGTPSVAEAAALSCGGELVVAKRKSAMATVALARIRPRGRLALVGLGPGDRDLVTPRAIAELRRASVVVGLDRYLDQIRDVLRPGTRVLRSGLGDEQERATSAVAEARQGHAVALVGSGDVGVYAMASPALAIAGTDIDVAGVPGITAALAAAALLGAPLGHDHVIISLSDLHTPWEIITHRIEAAGAGDFVVAFYNPRSKERDWQLGAALDILRGHRDPGTPAGVVHDAFRSGQQVLVTTLAELDPAIADMRSVVIVGSASTRLIAGRMVTPRGYRWQC